jgi:hypothetical protein
MQAVLREGSIEVCGGGVFGEVADIDLNHVVGDGFT